jgi:hypothetical protein
MQGSTGSIWSYMKNNGVSKRPLKKNESMKERIEEDLRMLHSTPDMVRSFFKAARVHYPDYKPVCHRMHQTMNPQHSVIGQSKRVIAMTTPSARRA